MFTILPLWFVIQSLVQQVYLGAVVAAILAVLSIIGGMTANYIVQQCFCKEGNLTIEYGENIELITMSTDDDAAAGAAVPFASLPTIAQVES